MPLGIYVSRCSGAVDETVDVVAVADEARAEATVARVVDDLFDPEALDTILDDVRTLGLDAVVLAGNSVEHYARSLSASQLLDRIAEAGINANRIVRANLLEQVALAHADDPAGATRKASALVRIAARRAKVAEPFETESAVPLRRVLVLGATSEALVVAQRLLQLGFEVIVADRGDALAEARASSMKATALAVIRDPRARFLGQVKVADAHGWLGDYHVELETQDGREAVDVGGILLARPEATEWVEELRWHFTIDVDDDMRARPLDPLAHPAETIDPGIMVVPSHREGVSERERIAAADSAAIALVLRLGSGVTSHHHDVSAVDESLCGGCATCVRTCAFGACSIDENGFSHVDLRRCRACGKCVVSCPVGARDIVSSPHDYLLEAVRLLAETETDGPKVIGFLCGGCGYPAADNAGELAFEGAGYPASFLPVRIPCGGRLDALYVLEAFRAGFDAVCVYRCREGHCHNLIGNLDMDRRINLLRTILRSRGLDDARLRIVDISPTEGERFIETLAAVYETIGEHAPVAGGVS